MYSCLYPSLSPAKLECAYDGRENHIEPTYHSGLSYCPPGFVHSSQYSRQLQRDPIAEQTDVPRPEGSREEANAQRRGHAAQSRRIYPVWLL